MRGHTPFAESAEAHLRNVHLKGLGLSALLLDNLLLREHDVRLKQAHTSVRPAQIDRRGQGQGRGARGRAREAMRTEMGSYDTRLPRSKSVELHAHMYVQVAAPFFSGGRHVHPGRRPVLGAMAAEDDDVLDLSGDALVAIDGTVPLTANLVELCLMHNRITVIERLEPLTALQKLNLRANRIETLGGLSTCTALKELELYENQISTLEGLEGLANLTSLDVSFNRVGQISGLEHAGLTALESLYLAHNRIPRIEGLAGLPSLTLLEVREHAHGVHMRPTVPASSR